MPLTVYVVKPIELGTWEANSPAAFQEIPNISYNIKIRYRVHKSLPWDPILSQVSPFHIHNPTSLRSTKILTPKSASSSWPPDVDRMMKEGRGDGRDM
jgi:hypothetical protein